MTTSVIRVNFYEAICCQQNFRKSGTSLVPHPLEWMWSGRGVHEEWMWYQSIMPLAPIVCNTSHIDKVIQKQGNGLCPSHDHGIGLGSAWEGPGRGLGEAPVQS